MRLVLCVVLGGWVFAVCPDSACAQRGYYVTLADEGSSVGGTLPARLSDAVEALPGIDVAPFDESPATSARVAADRGMVALRIGWRVGDPLERPWLAHFTLTGEGFETLTFRARITDRTAGVLALSRAMALVIGSALAGVGGRPPPAPPAPPPSAFPLPPARSEPGVRLLESSK